MGQDMSVPFYAARHQKDLIKELVSATPKFAALLAMQSHARQVLSLVTPRHDKPSSVELTSAFEPLSPVEEWLAKMTMKDSSWSVESRLVEIERVNIQMDAYSKRIDQALSSVYQKYGLPVSRSFAALKNTREEIIDQRHDEAFVRDDEKMSERELIRLACMIVRVAFPHYEEHRDKGRFFAQVLSQLRNAARVLPSNRPMSAVPPTSRRAIVTSVIYGSTNQYYSVLKTQKPSLFVKTHELTRRMISAVAGIAGAGEALNYFKNEQGSFHPSRLDDLEKHRAIVALDSMSPGQLKQQLFVASAKKSRFVDAIYTNNNDARDATARNYWQEFYTDKMARLVQHAPPTDAPLEQEKLAASFDRPLAY